VVAGIAGVVAGVAGVVAGLVADTHATQAELLLSFCIYSGCYSTRRRVLLFFFIYSSCFLSTRRRASALSGWAGAEALSGWAGVTKGALQRDQSGKHDYRGAAKEPYQEQTSPAKEPEESAL